MKRHIIMAAMLAVAAPVLGAQAPVVTTQPQAADARGPRHGPGRMFEQLGLTAAQKAQVKAIHEKYAAQFKGNSANRADVEAMQAARQKGDSAAMRAAREKLRADMAPMRQAREQEMNEIRAILTPAQQQKLDAMRAQMKQHEGERGARGPRGDRGTTAPGTV